MSEAGKLLMKFNTGVNLVGRPHGWNVDNIDASRCKIKLGGRYSPNNIKYIVTILAKVISTCNKITKYEST